MNFNHNLETTWWFPRLRGCDHTQTALARAGRGGKAGIKLVAPWVSGSSREGGEGHDQRQNAGLLCDSGGTDTTAKVIPGTNPGRIRLDYCRNFHRGHRGLDQRRATNPGYLYGDRLPGG